jgi:hypothetical protein
MKTKQYCESIKLNDLTFTLTFTGSDELGKDNPIDTDVNLKCEVNNTVKWIIQYGNIEMPSGPWNKYQNIHIFQNRLFLGLGNKLKEIDITNGTFLGEYIFGNTVIREIISDKNNIYIRYQYHKFDKDIYPSNIVCLNKKLNVVWYAELPESDDIYANQITIENKVIKSGSWNSWYCTINKSTGKIIDKEFTK